MSTLLNSGRVGSLIESLYETFQKDSDYLFNEYDFIEAISYFNLLNQLKIRDEDYDLLINNALTIKEKDCRFYWLKTSFSDIEGKIYYNDLSEKINITTLPENKLRLSEWYSWYDNLQEPQKLDRSELIQEFDKAYDKKVSEKVNYYISQNKNYNNKILALEKLSQASLNNINHVRHYKLLSHLSTLVSTMNCNMEDKICDVTSLSDINFNKEYSIEDNNSILYILNEKKPVSYGFKYPEDDYLNNVFVGDEILENSIDKDRYKYALISEDIENKQQRIYYDENKDKRTYEHLSEFRKVIVSRNALSRKVFFEKKFVEKNLLDHFEKEFVHKSYRYAKEFEPFLDKVIV